MTAVISGTNGLIQSYGYIDNTTTPVAATNGFNYTFTPSSTGTVLVINPAGTLATGTITMPASPADGMTITFSSSQQITALTMAGNGASINNAVTFLPAKTAVSYVYRATGTTWWPVQSVPGTGSQLVSGTAVASTSGTSIDFTGIPSWVKRITVMFTGVSTNATGSAGLLLQIGSGSTTTTGYISYSGGVNNSNQTFTGNSTAGFLITSSMGNTSTISGHAIITLFSSNIWVCSSVFGGLDGTSANVVRNGGGYSPSLSGALDRVRITTVNGTDAFDAGSINILYE